MLVSENPLFRQPRIPHFAVQGEIGSVARLTFALKMR